MTDTGVLYIAFGDEFVAQAVYSATSLKAHSAIHITLFTDKPVSSASIDDVVIINPAHKRAKIDFLPKSPYKRTIYIDSDTKIVRDISDIYEGLDRFDLAATHDHSRKSSRWASKIPEYASIPYAFPEHNGGLIAYRASERMDRFFALWASYFYKYRAETGGRDQASFRVSLWESDLDILVLPIEYNVRSASNRSKIARRAKLAEDEGILKPRILHWHGLNERKGAFDFMNPNRRPFRF